jgi:hypothetical protein
MVVADQLIGEPGTQLTLRQKISPIEIEHAAHIRIGMVSFPHYLWDLLQYYEIVVSNFFIFFR